MSTVQEGKEEAVLHLQARSDIDGWLKENIICKLLLCCFMKRMGLRFEPEWRSPEGSGIWKSVPGCFRWTQVLAGEIALRHYISETLGGSLENQNKWGIGRLEKWKFYPDFQHFYQWLVWSFKGHGHQISGRSKLLRRKHWRCKIVKHCS